MAKIDNDGAHIVKTQLRSTLETLADQAEKAGALNAIQPQLEHLFKIIFDMENNWEKIDEENEEKIEDNIIFKRPIDFEYCSLFCKSCNNVISTIEDVSMMKKEKVCELCYITYYYVNKEKWSQGWRPNQKSSD